MLLTIIFVAIFSGVSIIVPSWSIIYNPMTTGRSKITRGGYFLLLAVAALIVLPVLLYNQQKKDEAEKDKQTKIQQDKRDSIQQRNYDSTLLVMKLKFDTSNFKTTAIIADNLGKYGYKFDSANNRIIKMIKDSSKTKVIVGDDPILQILNDIELKGIEITSQTKNRLSFKVRISSSDAASTDFEIKYSAVAEDAEGKYLYIKSDQLISKRMVISKDGQLEKNLDIETTNYVHFVYIWLRGKYKNSDKTKTFNVDQVYYLNAYGNTYGIMEGKTYKKVIEKIKENEKD